MPKPGPSDPSIACFSTASASPHVAAMGVGGGPPLMAGADEGDEQQHQKPPTKAAVSSGWFRLRGVQVGWGWLMSSEVGQCCLVLVGVGWGG